MAAAVGTGKWRLTAAEREQMKEDGFVVRERVFDANEVARITASCEALVDKIVRDRQGKRVKASVYVFEPDLIQETYIKWEGDTDIVHGIEPFAHLSPELEAWAYDPRFTEPMQDFVGHPDPRLFTEKLNLKRPHVGGLNPLHQDYPYWVNNAQDPAEVATAMLFLDDSNLENGCLRVVPGSHKLGVWKKRTDGDRFAHNEIDEEAYKDVTAVPLEVPAGSVVWFGSLLAHRSSTNHSDKQRRALLYSYQPPGRPHTLDSMRKLARPRD
jgi:ectoine hydroxylase